MGRIYYQYVDITDFGPYVTRVILGMPRAVCGAELKDTSFSVYVETLDKAGNLVRLPKDFLHLEDTIPSAGYRPVLEIYPSDRTGEKRLDKSQFVTITMPYGPIYLCSTTLASDWSDINGHEYYTNCRYTITQLSPIGSGDEQLSGLVFDSCAGMINPKRDRFTDSVSHYEPLPLRYGYYLPALNGGKKPLIVWLHGGGEGGFETSIAYSGNKVTAFTEPYAQELFGGAVVFVPQADTMWLDEGHCSYEYQKVGRSIYTVPLKAAIDEFIALYKDVIDTDRIYIGGDSNGGFMTLRMILDYPGFFAAAFPICEALYDGAIPDEELSRIVDTPIWFTHSADDHVVLPEEHVLPTYRRLLKAGAKNVHLTYWPTIDDLHGEFKDENGNPWRYNGHFAWIPMLNDDCRVDYDGSPVTIDGKEVTLMQWLAAQHL